MEKTIFCFCHTGGENILLADGSIFYKGGITASVLVHGGTSFEEFKLSVFDRLNITPEGQSLYFTVKYNLKEFMLLHDDIGIQTLVSCNDEHAHVYASNSEISIVPSSNTASEDRVMMDPGSNLSRGDSSFAHVAAPSSINEATYSQSFIGDRWKDIITGVGQVFESDASFREAIYKFSIAHRFPYKFTHNKPRYLKIECDIERCNWKITASACGNTSSVSIKKMQDAHAHSVEDMVNFRVKFRSNLIGSVVIDKLANTHTYLPRQICKDAMDDYQVPLTYHQAWKSKENALNMLDGNIEDSYRLIMWYCSRLVKVMPDSIVVWSDHGEGTFKQLFVSYGCSIHGFHSRYRPIVFIDGCHLSGPYKGTLLAASSIDANNGIYPLAYGVVTSENDEDWLWFVQHIKHVIKDRDVVIISNRNPSLLKGVDTLFGSENHAYCYHHLQENFSSYINKNSTIRLNSASKKRAHQILDEIAYARTMSSYEKGLQKMHDFQPLLRDWVLQNKPEHWSNALFSKLRWDWLNSNIAESFNAWMGEARVYPIGKMMQSHVEKYAELLINKTNDLPSWKNGIEKRIEERLIVNIVRGQGFKVRSRPPHEFEIFERRKGALMVNISLHTCTCREWQMTGIPCPRACRAIQMQNYSIYDCVADCYKKDAQQNIYAQLMPGIPTIDMPIASTLHVASVEGESSENIVNALLPPKSKRPPGRPRKRRIESQFMDRRPVRCSRCNMFGHYRSTCQESL